MNFILNPENTATRSWLTIERFQKLCRINQDTFESWIRTLTLPELYRYQGASHCCRFLWSLSGGEESNYPLVSLLSSPPTQHHNLRYQAVAPQSPPQHHEKCLVKKNSTPSPQISQSPWPVWPRLLVFLKKIWQPVLLCCCGRLYLRDERTLPQSVLGINQHSCRVLS